MILGLYNGISDVSKRNKKMSIKICKVCGKEFEKYDKIQQGRAKYRLFKRSIKAVNCSKKCSRNYILIATKINRNRIKNILNRI